MGNGTKGGAALGGVERLLLLLCFGVCLTGALTVIAGGMTLGGLTSFLAYANRFTKPFNEISESEACFHSDSCNLVWKMQN